MADGRVVTFRGEGVDLTHAATSLLHVAWRGDRYEVAGGAAGWGTAVMDSAEIDLSREELTVSSGRLVVGRGRLRQTAEEVRHQIDVHRSQDPFADPPSPHAKDVDVEVAYASLELEAGSIHSQAYGPQADRRLISLLANCAAQDTPEGPVVRTPRSAEPYAPCSLVKWVPPVGLLHVWDRQNVSNVSGHGTPVPGGRLRYVDRQEGGAHFILVGDTAYTTILPVGGSTPEECLDHATSLRVTVTARRP